MEGGVKPVFTLISSGNIREYHSFLGSTTLFLEEDLYSSLGGLQSFQQRLIDRTYQTEADHYELVIMLVAVAMLMCVLIAFLSYVFLGRVVLRPLRLAGTHFDRIAGGDLRSEARRVGKGWVSTGRSRWCPYHTKKKH